MKFGLTAVLLTLCFFSVRPASAQFNTQDSIYYQAALTHTIKVYYNQLGDQSPLYNGSKYIQYPYTFRESTPYFPSDNFNMGTLVYDGMRFDSVALLYDNLRQYLVTSQNGYQLQLINERVSTFSISGHQFIRVVADSSNKEITSTGYYEVLYPGRSRVLKVTNQQIQEIASNTEGMIRYVESGDVYYVKSGMIYIRVKSKQELIKIFSGYEKEIKQFIKKNKLNYRKNKDNTFIQAAGYYDQIAK